MKVRSIPYINVKGFIIYFVGILCINVQGFIYFGILSIKLKGKCAFKQYLKFVVLTTSTIHV